MSVPKVNLRERKSKRKTSYFIDFAVKGKRYRLSAGTNKKIALEICQQKALELSRGYFNIPTTTTNNISIQDLVTRFLLSKRNHLRSTSLKRYQNYLDKYLEILKKLFPGPAENIVEIKTSYVEEIFNYLLENEITNGKKWEPKTVNGLRTILIQLFTYAIKQGYLKENIVKDTKTFQVIKQSIVEYFTDEELEKIWKEIDEYWVEPLKFIVHTGLRKGEWINLRWDNVQLDGDNPSIAIVSSGSWKTKTGESRVIPLNKTALEIIKKQKGRNKDYVFTLKFGSKIHPDKPYHSLKTALKNLELNGDVHKLRHTFASKLVMNGRSLYEVQKLLGHKDIKTTIIYAHLSPDYLKESVKVLE